MREPVRRFEPGADGIERRAAVSPCGRFRWWLTRRWDPALPLLGFALINPSTADAQRDDNTACKTVFYARRDGFGGVYIGNVSPYRATDPTVLRRAMAAGEDVGTEHPEQLEALDALARCPKVVCGWGPKPWLRAAAHALVARLRAADANLCALHMTADGSPGHPLFLRNDAVIGSYDPRHMPRAR